MQGWGGTIFKRILRKDFTEDVTFKQKSKDLYPCGYFGEEVSTEKKKKGKVYSSLCLACLKNMRRSCDRRSVSKLG